VVRKLGKKPTPFYLVKIHNGKKERHGDQSSFPIKKRRQALDRLGERRGPRGSRPTSGSKRGGKGRHLGFHLSTSRGRQETRGFRNFLRASTRRRLEDRKKKNRGESEGKGVADAFASETTGGTDW